MLTPASRFLCCFPLGLSVKFLLWLHLASNIYTCGVAINNVMMSFSGVGVGTSNNQQIFAAAWSMAGIPLILVAIWGASNQLEVAVRYYLYYLVVSAVIDTVYLIDLFILQDACVHIQLAVMAQGGKAFACGMARMFSGTAAVFATLGVIYMVYIIWSYCEELSSSGSAGVIGELLGRAEKKEEWSFSQPQQWAGRGDRINMDACYYGKGHQLGYNSVQGFGGRTDSHGYVQPHYA